MGGEVPIGRSRTGIVLGASWKTRFGQRGGEEENTGGTAGEDWTY